MIKYYAIPVIFLIASILWIVFPPKNRNYYYGYRSGRSMKNTESWYLANYFFSRALLIISIGLIAFHTVAILLIEKPNKDIISALMIGYFIVITSLIPLTELILEKFNSKSDDEKD